MNSLTLTFELKRSLVSTRTCVHGTRSTFTNKSFSLNLKIILSFWRNFIMSDEEGFEWGECVSSVDR